jgi:hypothetical protein
MWTTIFRKRFSSYLFGFFLFAFPASTNYQLRGYGFGSGGEDNMSSPNYAADAVTGEVSSGQLSGSSYNLGSGLSFEIMANVPAAPAFTNPSSYYNKLKVVLDTGSNPSDTKFAIAISTDNFATTSYVQSDNTVGSALGSEDYQTYAAWGGGSGFNVIGLAPSTTYKVKVKAFQGKFSESGYGLVATAATVSSQLSFSLSTNTINFGSLAVNTVNSSPGNIDVSFATNATNGGTIYVSGTNAGLASMTASHTISSVSGNLVALGQGFGAQGVSVTQSTGGPLTLVAPYSTVAGDVVGIIDTTIRSMFDSAGPITGGNGSFVLKAKPSAVTPSAADYSETLTVIATGRF